MTALNPSPRRKVVVYHTGYGCETGCCGHVIEVDGEQVGNFEFSHPYWIESRDGDRDAFFRAWAEELVRDAGCDPADLDWANCVVVDD